MINRIGLDMDELLPFIDDPLMIYPDSLTIYPNGDVLPGILISMPDPDDPPNPRLDGSRIIVAPYFGDPGNPGDPSDPGDPGDGLDDSFDPDGSEALHYGACYYSEAMGYTDPADHRTRVNCFRAAEILYRHAAGKGNAMANLNLGYVYSYDRCEGNYWVAPADGDDAGDEDAIARAGASTSPFPREERAFQCLSLAAEAEIPEACYKLGDMYKHGIGCEPDASAAFHCYLQASRISVNQDPIILGSIALRLAGCYEEGFGCEQDFSLALNWYQRAATALEAGVEAGDTWYEKALAGARAGVKRCQQEA